MTPEEARTAADIMLAWANGATIETKDRGVATSWAPIRLPIWNWVMHEYRVTPIKVKAWAVVGIDQQHDVSCSLFVTLDDAEAYVAEHRDNDMHYRIVELRGEA